MSKEKINLSHEYAHNPEAMAEIGAERSKEIRERLHEKVEKVEDANELAKEALEKANLAEKERKAESPTRQEALAERPAGPNKVEREASFAATMREVRSQMPATSRAFSKVIHNKTVEKVSDGVGSTVARPNAILSGAIFAFILTLSVYLIAKNLGYPLSGFETIAAFILGWVIGIIYDFLRVMITGRQ